MRKPAKRASRPARTPRTRNGHGRQRQRLIDACISALHLYGPSQTTVEKVVAIAKMSPGIVRFYFASKAAMLVASLQFLSSEFEEQLMGPVARLKSRPTAALELMVDLYLDPEIASPRKVSVWYAFWGEASSRQEYYDICGQKDESFARLVRELIGRLIADTGRSQLDADGVALGLIGVLEMLWQDFAFRDESQIDRAAAKARAMAYLRSVFPGQFGAPGARTGSHGAAPPPAPWVYADARQLGAERDAVFRAGWQLAGHAGALAEPGEFTSVDLKLDRVLLLEDMPGGLRAFRAADLTPLEVRRLGDLILVRGGSKEDGEDFDPWAGIAPPAGARPIGPPRDVPVNADWKIVVEQWLDEDGGTTGNAGWSARAYRALDGAEYRRESRFIAPNHWMETRPDGFTLLQALPVGPGQSLLRRHCYTLRAEHGPARAVAYLAARLDRRTRRAARELAESTQVRLATAGRGAEHADHNAARGEFRRWLAVRVPSLSLPRPPAA
jgi:TetR/AcrR family transcriptional repressor of bet genes